MKSIFVMLCLLCLSFVAIFGGNSRLLLGKGEPCGSVTCTGLKSECCNFSCSICVEPGDYCIQQQCEDGP